MALPPQLVANQFGVLPADLAASTFSAQALRFYRVPLFLLPIFQAAAIQYGVPWQVLAAINEVETDYGHDLSVSTAGAIGWMQFLPETWLQYGVDARRAGVADPYNPADAIFGAARYLRAAGAAGDLRGAIFAYNHSTSYVDSVLLRARLIAGYPEPVVASLTGLAEGQPPVAAGRWAATTKRPRRGPRFVRVQGSSAAPVVAVQDGKVIALGWSPALGRYLTLRDLYGDVYTYGGLGRLAARYPAPAPSGGAFHVHPGSGPGRDPRPLHAASAGSQPITLTPAPAAPAAPAGSPAPTAAPPGSPAPTAGPAGSPTPTATTASVPSKVRLFAHPPATAGRAAAPAPVRTRRDSRWLALEPGAIVSAGTRLGTLHGSPGGQGQMRFAIEPPGDPRTVDPAPILSNWRLLADAVRAGRSGTSSGLLATTAAEVFLEPKRELERQVLADPTISIYGCGRRDVASGAIDPRVLATLAFLSRSGLKPTVSALRCGQRVAPASSTAFERSQGDTVEISAVNGISIAGHQGQGTVTDTTIRMLLTLQGQFEPQRIVSLMTYPATGNTVARRDHGDRLEIAFAPQAVPRPPRPAAAAAARPGPPAAPASSVLDQRQWDELIARVAAIPAPVVATRPSAAAVPDPRGATLSLPFGTR